MPKKYLEKGTQTYADELAHQHETQKCPPESFCELATQVYPHEIFRELAHNAHSSLFRLTADEAHQVNSYIALLVANRDKGSSDRLQPNQIRSAVSIDDAGISADSVRQPVAPSHHDVGSGVQHFHIGSDDDADGDVSALPCRKDICNGKSSTAQHRTKMAKHPTCVDATLPSNDGDPANKVDIVHPPLDTDRNSELRQAIAVDNVLQFSETHDKDIFNIGCVVDMRDHTLSAGTWATGRVTSTCPLLVDGLRWDMIRKHQTNEAAETAIETARPHKQSSKMMWEKRLNAAKSMQDSHHGVLQGVDEVEVRDLLSEGNNKSFETVVGHASSSGQMAEMIVAQTPKFSKKTEAASTVVKDQPHAEELSVPVLEVGLIVREKTGSIHGHVSEILPNGFCLARLNNGKIKAWPVDAIVGKDGRRLQLPHLSRRNTSLFPLPCSWCKSRRSCQTRHEDGGMYCPTCWGELYKWEKR